MRLKVSGTAAATILLSSAAALLSGQPVQAQESVSSDTRVMLEEVIVTARKREESLQETPVAVTAITGDSLREQGINNITELTNSVPSLQINKGQSNQIFIRGIGQRASTLKVDPAVGVYVDGIFIPRSDGQFLDSLELANVQVLRGPQGTLFGKNNTGGALVFTLQKPEDEFGGHIGGTIGNYGTVIFNATANVPVSDDLAVRIGYTLSESDGYVDDIAQDETNNSDGRQALISQLRYTGFDSLVIDGLLYYGRTRERFPGNNCEVVNEDALLINGVGLLYPGDTDPNNPRAYVDACNANNRDNLPGYTTNMGQHLMDLELDTVLGGITLDWEINDEYTAKFIVGAGYQLKGPLLESDSDAGNLSLVENIFSDDSERDWVSVEAQLNGSLFDARLNFTAGLFAMVENNTEEHLSMLTLMGIDPADLPPLLGGPPLPLPIPGSTPVVGSLGGPMNFYTEFDLRNTTIAAFSQASWDITENLQLTGGLRYTVEIRDATLESTFTDNAALSAQLTACDPRFTLVEPGMALHTFAGSWLEDPVGRAMDCFPDINGDGYFDAPLESTPQVDEQNHAFKKLTPMVSLSYVFPDDMLDGTILSSAMAYGTYSTGFKSGFFEPRGADGLQRIEPEVVNNSEVGFKIDAFERSLRLNVAAYHMLFEDMQLIQVSTDSTGTLAIVFANVGESVIQGVEAELTWVPSAAWLVSASFSQNDYDIKEFTDGDIFQLFLGGSGTVERDDERLPVSPDTTASLGVQYMFDTAVGLFTPRIDIAYKSDIYLGFDRGSWLVYQQDEEKATADAYTLINLRFSWMNPEGDLTAAVFVKNAADEEYDIGAVSIGDTLGTFNRVYGAPRMYGLEVRKTF